MSCADMEMRLDGAPDSMPMVHRTWGRASWGEVNKELGALGLLGEPEDSQLGQDGQQASVVLRGADLLLFDREGTLPAHLQHLTSQGPSHDIVV